MSTEFTSGSPSLCHSPQGLSPYHPSSTHSLVQGCCFVNRQKSWGLFWFLLWHGWNGELCAHWRCGSGCCRRYKIIGVCAFTLCSLYHFCFFIVVGIWWTDALAPLWLLHSQIWGESLWIWVVEPNWKPTKEGLRQAIIVWGPGRTKRLNNCCWTQIFHSSKPASV